MDASLTKYLVALGSSAVVLLAPVTEQTDWGQGRVWTGAGKPLYILELRFVNRSVVADGLLLSQHFLVDVC